MEFKQIIKSDEYNFLREHKNLGNRIILLTLGGSHSYGTNTDNSDIDIRGVALEKPEDLIGFSEFDHIDKKEEVNNTDTVIYSFNKVIRLLTNSNPNVIEMLGIKEEHILQTNDIGRELIENRRMFLSKQCIGSFGGYAYQQINRMSNKIVNEEDYKQKEKQIINSLKATIYTFNSRYSEIGKNIDVYLGDNFIDSDKEIKVDINIKGYPLRDLSGVMSEMDNILKTYGKINSRNNKNTREQINKHCMHLIRLYYTAIDILEKGDIITYRGYDKEEHELYKDIRKGKFMLDDGTYHSSFEEIREKLRERFEYASKHTELPELPDMDKIEEYTMEVNKKIINGT